MEDAPVVSDAVKKFRQDNNPILALDNVSFSIKSGEISGLLGPNGAGKTTLISAVCGLLELDFGKIEMFGKDVLHERDEVINQINLVTGFAGLLNGLNVEDLLWCFFRLPASVLYCKGTSYAAETLADG